MTAVFFDYLHLFHIERDYFECHELLEEHWKEEGQTDERWVGFIQLAVALYHQRRGNFNGAERMLAKGAAILRASDLSEFPLDISAFYAQLDELQRALAKREPYRPVTLPLVNVELRWDEAIALTDELANESLTERHRLRDRSDVIAARLAAKEKPRHR